MNFHKDTTIEEYFVCHARKNWLQEEAFEEDLDQLDVWYKDVIQDKEVKEWSSQCQFLCKVKGCGFETKKRLEFVKKRIKNLAFDSPSSQHITYEAEMGGAWGAPPKSG